MNEIRNIVGTMKSSPVLNYAIAGVDSYLLERGKVRLFECTRDHQDNITPHSHRFDFACLVLSGSVTNRIWIETDDSIGDLFEKSWLQYSGNIGEHTVTKSSKAHYEYRDFLHSTGQSYSMKRDQIHSIRFSKGAKVLFFEGPEVVAQSAIIQPVVNDKVIPTYQKLDWMFLAGEAI